MEMSELNEVLNLDCREDYGKNLLQEYLKKIKPLSKYKHNVDVPFEKVEKVITILSKKYNMRVIEIMPDIWANDDEVVWRAILIDDKNLNKIGAIYGISLYEIFSKVAICMYFMRNDVGER